MFTSLVYTGNVLFGALCGWIIDRYGVRRFLLIGPAILVLFFLILPWTPSYGIALALVMLGGFGYVFINPSAAKALTIWFSPERRATAIGIMKSGVNAGGALGAAVLPTLALLIGWRNGLTYVVVAVIGLNIFVMAIYRDPPGQVYKATISFGLREMRQVVTNRSIVLLGCVGMAYSAIQLSTSTYLVLFLMEHMHLSVVLAGTYLATASLSGAAGRVIWGIVSDRVFQGRRKIVLFIIGLISGALAISIAFTTQYMQGWLLYLIMAIFGFASFGWMGVHVTYLAELAGADQAGTAVGFGLSITGLGILFGPPLFGYIVDITQSYAIAWTVLGIIATAGGILALMVKGKQRHNL
jgi:MFS family permease